MAPPDQLVPTGTIMIAALTFLIGFQLVLSFLNYDISASPREPLHPLLAKGWRPTEATTEAGKADAIERHAEQGASARRKAQVRERRD